MEGFEDPFNRGTFPWGHENISLQKHFTTLGKLRLGRRSLQMGELRWLFAEGHALAFARCAPGEITAVALNAGEETAEVSFPWPNHLATDVISGQQFVPVHGRITLRVPGLDSLMLI